MAEPKYLALTVFFVFAMLMTSYAYGEESSSLQIEVKYTNGDRIDAYQTNYVIYQDSDKNPFLEKKLETNPETVTLPKDHRYKVEVYVNGMFSEVGYIELKNSLEKLEVNIPLPGGLKFNVFFEDGETPIDGATVIIKSHDGQEQKVGKTDDLGQTMRYWLQSTNLKDDFYVVEVYFDEFLLTSVSNIKIHQGIAQEQKIIVPIPSTVEDLLVFYLHDTESNKILKNNGNYSVMLTNQKNIHLVESISGSKGEIYFSNLVSGIYTASVLKDGEIDPLWRDLRIIISGKENEFNLAQTNQIMPQSDKVDSDNIGNDSEYASDTIAEPIIYEPSTEKFTLSCQCVSFRLDDVQDYWLNNIQLNLMDVFSQNKIPLTVGIIANSFGEDEKITEMVKSKLEKNEITIANHGLDSTPFTLFDKNKQDSMLKESTNKIFDDLGVSPKIFIPPQNRFNEDTKEILIENGFTHLSASKLSDSEPFPLKNQQLYRFPELSTTGDYVPSQNRILGVSAEKTYEDAMIALEKYGFVVITIHPQEYSVFQGGEYLNEINHSQMNELMSLIEKVKAHNLQVVNLDEINSKIKMMPTKDNSIVSDPSVPSWIKNNAGWWRDGHIDDNSFLRGIEYLIQTGVIQIPSPVMDSNKSEIPSWIKDNAGWWAEGRISDDDFIYGVSYLVNHGIIVIEL